MVMIRRVRSMPYIFAPPKVPYRQHRATRAPWAVLYSKAVGRILRTAMAMTAHPQLKVAYVVREFPVVGDERLLDELLALEHSQVDLQVFSLNRSNSYRQPSKAARLHAPIGYPPARRHVGGTSLAAATTPVGERRLARSRSATRPEASCITGAVLDAGIQ